MAKRNASPREIANGIGKYLRELENGASGRGIHLGPRIGVSTDPEAVDAAAARVAEQIADTSSPIARLKLTQRRRELEAVSAELRSGSPESWEPFFVEHAAAYAETNGIEYGTFRELGVPATVLRDAGIER